MSTGRAGKTARLSLLANLTFAFYTGAVGITQRSWWFVALAAYYVILSVMRFAVLAVRHTGGTDVFIARFVGAAFMALAVTLAGVTYMAFEGDGAVRHHEIVMITIALYAFLKLTIGSINLIKCRRSASAVLRILRNISFADGLVSIFSLQRSMLVSFEGMSAGNIALMNALTGSAVYLMVFMLGINLIGGKRVTMAKSKLAEANKKIAETVVDGYKKIEGGVVEGYKKIEDGVVGGYKKVEDRFIESFLMRDGETVEQAKARLKKEQEKE